MQVSVRFSEASAPDSILSNQKSNKVYKWNYCTTNKLSNFQSLKWEIANKPISDATPETKFMQMLHSLASMVCLYMENLNHRGSNSVELSLFEMI